MNSIQLNQSVALSTSYHKPASTSTSPSQRLASSFLATTTKGHMLTSFGIKKFSKRTSATKSRAIQSELMMPEQGLQSVDQVPTKLPTPTLPDAKLTFLLVCDAFNSMAQRASLKLKESGHDVNVHIFKNGDTMIAAVEKLKPDAILCPFLTKRIPAQIYTGPVPCLIIHPGIEGDRGMSSIDWALQESQPEWGVTILQAEEEMDAGPIWATSNFRIRRSLGEAPTKSSLYRIECVDAAMRCIDDVLHKVKHNIAPRPLDYSNPSVRGCLRPKLMQADRRLNWELPAEELARIIRAGDSQPGTLSVVANEKFLLFGAHVESHPPPANSESRPMDVLGQRDGAVLIRCGFGTALWISHLKKNVKSIKLPATSALPTHSVSTLPFLHPPALEVPFKAWPETFQEIFYWNHNDVTYLWFDFYNGAMSTDQCRRLSAALDHIDEASKSKVLVLMGGVNYFSNGIHLNTIEAADDPAHESWENINAIDDVVRRILACSKRVTVSAMLGNAGAGGVMTAIAADVVWAHRNVVLHPSYKPMELYGSEYWTYSLPKRVGVEVAGELVSSTEPVSASQAKRMGLIDEVLAPSTVGFVESVIERAEKIGRGTQWSGMVEAKERMVAELRGRWKQHRDDELVNMKACFESEVYHQKRRDFVYKSAGSLSCQAELNGSLQKRTGEPGAGLETEDQQRNSCSFRFPKEGC
ncbi:hypothetical protein KC19_9G128500 [Ceratodon purpureus]|uniref:Uncharacterized protein n=1 Tax=Ceratodon purpureus TaxID=3225 RepID=A0A8T0GZ94_CERPU|nr:hypothetical protein KC19_9G128500 [Ceratodon purpureus]